MYRLTTVQEAERRTPRPAASLQELLRDPSSLPAQIGRTPLLRLRRIRPANPAVELFAKAEWLNPGGSVKDRAALGMLLEGERTGALRPGKTIIDATSGNTGIAYAMLGSVLGF